MNYDLETAIEDALIALISECTQIETVRWEDIKEAHLAPVNQTSDVIKVQVIDSEEEDGTYNLFAGTRMTIDIGVFASKKRDLASRKVNEARGVIRSVLAQSDIVDLINAQGDLVVYDNGVIVLGSSLNLTDEKNYGKGVTIQVVARPK